MLLEALSKQIKINGSKHRFESQVFSIQAPSQLQAGKLAASVLRGAGFLIKRMTKRARKEQSNQHAERRKLMPQSNTATRSKDTRVHIRALGIEEREERSMSPRNTTHNSSQASRHAHKRLSIVCRSLAVAASVAAGHFATLRKPRVHNMQRTRVKPITSPKPMANCSRDSPARQRQTTTQTLHCTVRDEYVARVSRSEPQLVFLSVTWCVLCHLCFLCCIAFVDT